MLSLFEGREQPAYQKYAELIEHIDAVFVKITLRGSIGADCMEQEVDMIYLEHRLLLEFVTSVRPSEKGRAKNAVDAAVIAAAMAHKIHLSLGQSRTVIKAALLHDVGMFDIPREILEKPQALSKSEGWHILNHPLQSYKIISRYLRCFEDVALIALQHHEAWNGEGYPKRLEGTDIELESRIVRIADAFTALISERPYRPAFGGHQAMKWLVSGTMVQFDPQLLRSFVHLMGMYPVGSLAELNNGSIVQVLEYPEGVQALKPRVRIINPGVFKPGETIDLRDEQGLFIKKALEREIMLMEAQDKLIG